MNAEIQPYAYDSSTQNVEFVLGHPDDEALWIGKMLGYLERGVNVTAIAATNGELGIQDHMPPNTTPEQMSKWREDEFIAAMTHLGVKPKLLRLPDSQLPWYKRELAERILEITREERPDSMDSFYRYEVSDYYDHLDHNAVGEGTDLANQRVATKFDGKGQPMKFRPELSAWTTNLTIADQYIQVNEKIREFRNEYLAKFYRTQFPRDKMVEWTKYFDTLLYKRGYGPIELYRRIPRVLKLHEF